MSYMIEKSKNDGKVMSSRVAKYIDDIAKGMDIDLRKADDTDCKNIE